MDKESMMDESRAVAVQSLRPPAPFRVPRSAFRTPQSSIVHRPALILLVVLVMVVLLSLLAAGFTFMVRANLSTVMADHHRFQARMAAQSGVQRAIVILRNQRDDIDAWFDNPDEFRGALVYGTEGKDVLRERAEDDTYDPHADPAWRFNLVAPNEEDPDTVRYGITDERARLDLNVASGDQLRRLFELTIVEDSDHEVDFDVLVDSLLDWREGGNQARPNGAKDEYYQSLDPPYRCKKGRFSTVEELLLVRGFTAWVLFGEDYNRNGLLDENEDDGDESFPPDNADGELYRGIAPFLTVWSGQEFDTSNDNRPRINLNMQDTQKLQELLEEDFDSNITSYVMDVRASGKTFNSVMNLIPAPPPPEEEEELDDGSAKVAPTTSETGGEDSEPDNGKRAGSQEGLSDLDETESASENNRAPRRPVYEDLTEEPPPGTYDDLPLILDRLTVSQTPLYTGRINISTAPREVLATIEELTDEELDAILTTRGELDGKEKATPAWLLTHSVLDETKFRQILDRITTKATNFRIESVGYADHLGVVVRLNTVIEMRGPIAQVLYHRDLSGLGPAYRPHGEERRGVADRSD